MEFDKSKVYSAVNADEVKVGSKGYFADDIATLKYCVECNVDDRVRKLVSIESDNSNYRFMTVIHTPVTYNLFYLLEEPIEEKYRPYNSIEEFLNDYCDRFEKLHPNLKFPQIWITTQENIYHSILSYDFDSNRVVIGNNTSVPLDWLFCYCTYIDGSRCGMKIEGEIND